MTKVEVNKFDTLTGHKDCIYTLERSKDSNIFFSAAADGLVAQWDLDDPQNGSLVARVNNSVYAICLVEHQNLLVVGENHEGIHVVQIDEKMEAGSLKLPPAYFFDIQFHNDLLLIASGNGSVSIVDLPSLTVKKVIEVSDKSARAISINKELGEFAVGYSDHTIRIFGLDDFSLRNEIQAHGNSVFTVRYSPDGRYLISGSRDAHLKVWDPTNGYKLEASIVAHMYAINHIDFSPNGKHFVTCSMDKSIKVWDYSAFRLLKVIDKSRHAGHGTSVNKLLWTNYQNRLVSASDDRTLSVWDLNFNEE